MWENKIRLRSDYRILYQDEELKKKEVKDTMIFYYPHLRKVRNELPTTKQYMFTM